MQWTKKCPKYTYRKDGVYYFSKAVPKEHRGLYAKPRIVKYIGTRSPQSARFVSKAMLAKLEESLAWALIPPWAGQADISHTHWSLS